MQGGKCLINSTLHEEQTLISVRTVMDINEQERLSNFTLGQNYLKSNGTALLLLFYISQSQ
jgi:hypothetical protein